MSFLSVETSAHQGAPVELYAFALNGRYWRHTTGQTTQTHAGQVYDPAAFSRSPVEASQEFGKAKLKLDAGRDFGPAAEFIPGTPEGIMTLTVYRRHRGDAETVVIWKGRVIAATYAGSRVTLDCEPNGSRLRQTGVRAIYELRCRHNLYRGGCGVTKEAFVTTATLSDVSGSVAQSAAFAAHADGWYTGGYLTAGYARRMIIAHAGASLTLSSPIPGLAVGASAQAYAGCNHTLTACNDKFSNALRFGGFPWLPTKNPFKGDAIY